MPIIAARPTTDHIAISPVVQVSVLVFLTVGMNRFATRTIPKTSDMMPATKFAMLNFHPLFRSINLFIYINSLFKEKNIPPPSFLPFPLPLPHTYHVVVVVVVLQKRAPYLHLSGREGGGWGGGGMFLT
jgi:hypothetical protein